MIIVGAGGLGRETAALVEAINEATSDEPWALKGFVDDNPDLQDSSILGYPVLGDVGWLSRQEEIQYVIAVGTPPARRSIAHRLSSSQSSPVRLIHPSVPIHATMKLGEGCIICSSVSPTVSIRIGDYAIVNLHCTIGHDTVIGDYVTLHPGVHLSGNTYIASGAELGTGSVVLPGIRIEENATVGAGAIVTRDLPADCTAVGMPAHPLDA